MRYTVVLEQGRRNWEADIPDIPGCISTGKTRDDAERNIREAIRLHLRSMLRDGDPLPEPGTWTTEVDVDVESLRAEASAARAAG